MRILLAMLIGWVFGTIAWVIPLLIFQGFVWGWGFDTQVPDYMIVPAVLGGMISGGLCTVWVIHRLEP
jgi:hypothetical protein